MTRRVSVRHRIEVDAGRPIDFPTHWARLRPAPTTEHRIAAYTLRIESHPSFLNWVHDPLQNHLARIDFPEPLSRIALEVEILIDLEPTDPFDFLVEPEVGQYPFAYAAQLRKELAPQLRVPHQSAAFANWAASLERSDAYVIDRLSRSMAQIRGTVTVDASAPIAPVDLDVTLSSRSASPWALAWLSTLGLRSLGFATRFVSGYVVAPGDSPAVPVALRAWSEVFLPGAGWIGIDPTTGLFVDERYIPLCAAPEPGRARPLVPEREVCGARRLDVLEGRVLEPMERPLPHGVPQRQALQELARRLDTDLSAAVGSFAVKRHIALVSAKARKTKDWTDAALDDDKRSLARGLAQRLRARLAPSSVPLDGQGPWYSGEALPRWRLMCTFRTDRRPLWRQPDATAFAENGAPVRIEDVRRCAEEVTRRLGLALAFLQPAHEDPLLAAWRDRAVWGRGRPDEDLADPERRQRLAQRLAEDAGQPAGYVLPLHRDRDDGAWRSGLWDLRRDAIYLEPGESPLGFRLPLHSLRPPTSVSEGSGHNGRSPADVDEVPRTALCFELRDGRLHVFLPPVDGFQRYVDLITAIDEALTATGLGASLEGYDAPDDVRLRQLTIEPDIGILRVGLPESSGWSEHAELLRIAYEECLELGLQPHAVSDIGTRRPIDAPAPLALGGVDTNGNPIARDPRLLERLIRTWQRHPCLSYLFATRARADESVASREADRRPDAAYELDLGLQRLTADAGVHSYRSRQSRPSHPSRNPIRALQHLLTDAKLDPRNCEIRIDELTIATEAAAERGRLILRAFGTPPDAVLATAQSVLVAALIAALVRSPPTGEIHSSPGQWKDRLLLPQPLWADLCLLLAEIEAAGYGLHPEWFRPFLDFHFPVLGHVRIADMSLELRKAHEPQPVLAEQVTTVGTVRFVDVANERIQVRATGLSPGRHAVSCNGRLVPLHGTGTEGDFICGIRYKACDPAFTLHPTLPAVDELVFDLIDLDDRQRIGGCTYRPAQAWAGPISAARPVDYESEVYERAPAPPSLPGLPPPAPPAPREPIVMTPIRASGLFLPHGTGPGEPEELRQEPGHPYVLDLTTVS